MSKAALYHKDKIHSLKEYSYDLPKENVRKEPLKDRDTTRLFVYDTRTDTVHFDYFYNLAKYLPERSLMILNNTGVIPARVTLQKDTGGKLGGLILMNEGEGVDGAIPAIVDEKLIPGRKVCLPGDKWFTITHQVEQRFYLKPEFERDELEAFLLAHGITPVPFYLGKIEAGEDELRTRYQTIFAKEKRSVAAPTASLHFTERVFETLQEKGIERKEITLDVGLGTFAEVEEHNVINRKLHFERFEIGEETVDALREAKASGKDVIAVGTTVTRTLEASAEFLRSEAKGNYTSITDLFILPPYDFKMVDHLITNFHVPNSSLMALVDAFLLHKGAKRRILELYKIAADEGFMFYSFGDSMLIL